MGNPEPHPHGLHSWFNQYESNAGVSVMAGSPMNTSVLKELVRENRNLINSNDIQHQISAYFAKAGLQWHTKFGHLNRGDIIVS